MDVRLRIGLKFGNGNIMGEKIKCGNFSVLTKKSQSQKTKKSQSQKSKNSQSQKCQWMEILL